jgi:hypothetical protein
LHLINIPADDAHCLLPPDPFLSISSVPSFWSHYPDSIYQGSWTVICTFMQLNPSSC